jgi:type III pantothenate kinase
LTWSTIDGAYIGGVIAPGVNLSLEALHMAAAALPHVDVTKPQGDRHEYGRLHAVRHLVGAMSGWWKEIVRQIRAERDRPMKVIGTGGLACAL